ncbi:MAG TPA: glycosyltransferase family 39 protein [Pseudolabrys sp.]|jgi:hypothetical protein|nr:glycosyltransferase family 39 protein [Pseudolabrys sp.]
MPRSAQNVQTPEIAGLRELPLVQTVIARPERAFGAFLALHALVWVALPTLLYANLPLDLIEALIYGREWQLGYDKLPPLPWWLVEIAYRVIGHDFAYYLLAQIAVVSAFAFVWATARRLVGPAWALAAVLIIDGLHYFNYTAVKFNHDVIQLPFWALAGFALHRALREGLLKHWLLLGLAIGMSLWAKYFVIVLAAPMMVFVLVDRDARKTLATPGPYIAVATALIVMAPHLVWLVQNDFLPFAYAEHRAVPARGLLDHFWHPLQFAVGQLFFLLPAILIAVPLFTPSRSDEPSPVIDADAFDRRIVAWLAFGPLVMVLAMAAVSGRGTVAMWGYPLWLFLGLWLVLIARTSLNSERLARILITWAAVFCVLALAFIANYTGMQQLDHRYRAEFFPGEALAQAIGERYRAATGKPVAYVISKMYVGGNIEHYAPSHPRVLIDGKPQRAPWISLDDLRKRGAVVVWVGGDLHKLPAEFNAIAKGAEVQPPLHLPYRRGSGATDIGWAILKPQT